jgi:acyl-coenzyme A synthetase/AMP-(fatty) acid ligase
MKHGATLVLVSEEAGKDPLTLAALIAEERITSWYSAPSILSLLAQFGRLERFDYSALRFVHFAGEVFPVRHLRSLKAQIPHPRYFNLYGPTETNVCTFHEIPAVVPEDRVEPYPIGTCCAHYRHRIVDEAGRSRPRGEEGELWIAGPGVMAGYWNAPERDAEVFRSDPGGERWYRTGDLVVEAPDGTLLFRGRRDRMVKRRGYRIELGEIEATLYRHPELKEAAVLADRDAQDDVQLRCFVTLRAGKPSVIRMKQFCAEHLLSYMVPDVFVFLDALPRTSTGKVDYQRLKELP